jgi:hypothetical protein
MEPGLLSQAMGARTHPVKVSPNDQELARLDEMRGDEERAVYLRRLLHEPPRGTEVATHGRALLILTRLVRDARTTAAIALEKAPRGEQPASEPEEFLRDA